MDENRALRDKLEQAQSELRRVREHLEKLRAHHARERDSLVRQLEDARRELAELKALTGKPGGLAPREPQSPRTESARGALYSSSTVYVGLARLPGPGDDEALRRLSQLSAVSLADLRMRMAAPPPLLLTRLSGTEAETLVRELRAEGFAAVGCELKPRAAASPLSVRRFQLEDTGLRVEGERGERLERVRVPWEQLRLLVRGRRTTRTVEKGMEADLVLDGTSLRTVTSQFEVTNEDSGRFLWAYGPDVRVAFTSATDFNGLGARRGLSRGVDLQAMAEVLRERAPHVAYDDRLMRYPSLSIPLVDSERTHELFAELLWQAVKEGVL
ncbi:hypothetical protein [Archangium sp.]|uniref:hypothetical protein n=1 Tax=Archangium sp. TaxID=1872627 RepID=UPI00389ABC0F